MTPTTPPVRVPVALAGELTHKGVSAVTPVRVPVALAGELTHEGCRL